MRSTGSILPPQIQNALPFMAIFEGRDSLFDSSDPKWLSSVWQHQLDARIADDVAEMSPHAVIIAEHQGTAADPVIVTYRDLFWHPSPPIELLKLVKEFAKREAVLPEDGLPQGIASCLYHLSILRATTQLGTPISSLSSNQLGRAIKTLSSQAWLDARTIELLAEGLSMSTSADVDDSTRQAMEWNL
jgi:hypothetical protein